MSARAGARLLALTALLAGACANDPPASSSPPPDERSAGAEPMPSPAEPSQAVSDAPSIEAPTAVSAVPTPLPSDPVFLNGAQLAEPDLRELEAVLGQPPTPGRYWYDARSGLWGLEEHGAGGVTRPGLRVSAALPADASRGTSGAIVNDRQITVRELALMAQLMGWDASRPAALAGRYVLDEQGGLYSIQGRYLGSLAASQHRASLLSASPAPCAWLQLGTKPDVLGRSVTINCD